MIWGGTGDDWLDGGTGNDRLMGEWGQDSLFGGDGADYMDGSTGDDFVYGQDGEDELHGGKGSDALSGGNGNDELKGGSGDDFLDGNANNDLLVGGTGRDILSGGSGRDVFAFEKTSDSVSAIYAADVITDFKHGVDKIDISAIDANLAKFGNNKFEYVDYDPSRQLKYGEVTSHYDAGLGKTIVELANDNMAGADMRIALNGNVPLDAQDFHL